MKFNNNVDFTWMGALHNAWYINDVTDEREIYALLENFKTFTQLPYRALPMFFVLNYTTRKYMFYSESAKFSLGYDARELLEGGLDIALHLVQKDYFKTFNEKVFPLNLQFLNNTPQQQHQDYVFSFTNQYRKKNGDMVELLQKGSFITSKETGLPLYSLGTIIDLTPYKKDNVIVQSIERITNKGEQLIETNYFYPFEEDTLLTKQEKNIVKWMADGLSSKMIANKLCISENTIANHRKNMLRKTNTRNVAQLIAFVIRYRII
jgi:DNA-binding CsgD family transcriptional regulator